MTPLLRARLARLGRWPRRILALLLLLLAAASALDGAHPTSASGSPEQPRATAPADALRPGEFAVPVTVRGAAVRLLLHRGDRVELYAAPPDAVAAPAGTAGAALLGRALRVLSVAPAAGQGEATSTDLVVAADRATVARLATASSGEILAVLDKYP